MKISELQKQEMNKIDTEGEIVERGEARTVQLRAGGESTVTDFTLKDDTGSIKLPIWGDQANEVNVGDKVQITNGYTKTFKGDLSLNVGKYGELRKL